MLDTPRRVTEMKIQFSVMKLCQVSCRLSPGESQKDQAASAAARTSLSRSAGSA